MKTNRKPNGGIGVAQPNQKKKAFLSSSVEHCVSWPPRSTIQASVSALVGCSMSRTPYLSQLIPWNSSPIAAGPLPPWSCLQLPTLWPGQERFLAGRDWEFICVLVADVLSSASSKSTTVSGQLLLMSRPLWPEDVETLCPSVPLHMRHVLVPLHLVSHFYLASACLMSCHVCRLTSSRSSSPLFMCGTFVLLPLFLFIPPHPLHSSCRHDGIQRHITVTPDLLPLLSARHLYDIMLW